MRQVKLTVSLPGEAVEAVNKMAEEQGKTKTKILREAIWMKVAITTLLSRPNARLLIDDDGVTRELEFYDDGARVEL